VIGVLFSASFGRSLGDGLRRSGLTQAAQGEIYAQRAQLGDVRTSNAAGQAAVSEAFEGSFRLVLEIAAGLSLLSALAAAWLVRPLPEAKATAADKL